MTEAKKLFQQHVQSSKISVIKTKDIQTILIALPIDNKNALIKTNCCNTLILSNQLY